MREAREVTVVTGLVTEKVLTYDGDVKMYEHDPSTLRRFCTTGTEEFLKFDSECLIPSTQTRIYPVHHFRWGSSHRDLYVAYTKDVEQILGIPINIMKEDLENIQKANVELHKQIAIKNKLNVGLTADNTRLFENLKYFRNMSFWNRLKFLFKGNPV